MFRLGCDIGGTFTDFVLLDGETGDLEFSKVLTTPSDPSEAVDQGVADIDERRPEFLGATDHVIHGTTLVINALIERSGAKTALVTTRGFRDVLAMRREARYDTYDITARYPTPLVTRDLRFEVTERVYADGQVAEPLDAEEARQVLDELVQQGIESVAVCFLHSYANAANERAFADLAARYCPEVTLSLSSEVLPEIQEYPRTSTTVVNAFVKPLVGQYLGRLDERLTARSFDRGLYLMLSGGGVVAAETARQFPVRLVESGPVGGALAAAHIGGIAGLAELLSFDMGGTTAKTGLIQDGVPHITKEYEVGAAATASDHGGKGGGYPLRTPVIDLVEIGAGGGSIAWVDSGDILRVGPQSAGADPGPVSYGTGGAEPTITDANLILGRIDAEYFLGGEITLDVDSARSALEEKCGRLLKMDVVDVAHGIVEIANAAMAGALRRISIQRGFDPRDFALVAFGGAGPLHANRLAAELGIPTVIVPRSPGTFSAMGLLATDLKHDYNFTSIERLDHLDSTKLVSTFEHLKQQGRDALERDRISVDKMRFEKLLDLRYVGQSYELPISIHDEEFSSVELTRLASAFHAEHTRVYGFNAPGEPIEVVNLRLSAIGDISKPALRELQPGSDPEVAKKSEREVYFAEKGAYVTTPIFDRYRLGAGCCIEGPAIVEEMDSTTLIHPGYTVRVDPSGNLLIQS